MTDGRLPRILLEASLLILLIVLGACDTARDDEPAPRGVLVANQGNFTDGNGSVSAYDPVNGAVRAGAVTGLGSIVQSINVHGMSLYVLSNAAGRVDVFDGATLERSGQINEVVSPRYMVADGSTAYVSSLFGGAGTFTGGLVTILDLAANAKVAEIEVGNNPEGLALVGSRLYVANHGFGAGSTVSVVDVTARAVVETIDVDCDGPRFLAADADADVFVFCTGENLYNDQGELVGTTAGAVRVLDGATGEIVARFEVDGSLGTVGPGQDAFHAPDDDAVFVVKDARSILVFDTEANALEEELGPFDGEPISAVAFDGRSDRLYLGRSRGFLQAGDVSVHDAAGTEIGRFTAGIVPTFITFVDLE